MKAALVADTAGLLRALARRVNGKPSWPDHEKALRDASTVFVPSLVLPEIDYFLRNERSAMRRFIAELFDPGTRYQFEQVHPADTARAMQLDAKFESGLTISVRWFSFRSWALSLVRGSQRLPQSRARCWEALSAVPSLRDRTSRPYVPRFCHCYYFPAFTKIV